MKKVYNRAQELKNKFGFRVVPVYKFKRDKNTGAKEFKFNLSWSEYREKEVPEHLFDHAEGLAILTGKPSNLIVIDLDSLAAISSLEKACGNTIDNLCSYRVKTNKGYQLFFKYCDLGKSTFSLNATDILVDGRITFADSATPGYEVCENPTLTEIPPCVLKYITDPTRVTNRFVEREIKNYFLNPLTYLLDKWQIQKKNISQQLKNEISTRLLDKIPYAEANMVGNRHNLMAHFLGICASDPTVSEKQYYRDCIDFVAEVIQPDEEIDTVADYCYKESFDFDPEWETKHKDLSSLPNRLYALGWITYYDMHADRYILINTQNTSTFEFSGAAYKIQVQRLLGEKVKIDLADIPGAEAVFFSPTKPSGRIDTEDGRLAYNIFYPTPNMETYMEFRSSVEKGGPKIKELPEFIGAVLENVLPIKEHRDLFLHNLSYFLKYRAVCATAIVSLGNTQGTGKGLLYDKILTSIFSRENQGENASISYTMKLNPQALNSNFNGGLKNKLFVHFNEVVENSSKYNTQTLVNKLKNIIAEDTITIISKGQDERVYANHMFVCMSSNEAVPFKIDAHDNRRFNFFPTNNKKFAEVYPKIKSMHTKDISEVIKNEMPSFLHYLASLELSPLRYQEVIKTELYKNIKECSTPLGDRLAEAIQERNLDVLEEEADPKLFEKFKTMVVQNNLSYIKVSDLRQILGTHYNSFKYAMISKGFVFDVIYLPMEKKQGRVCLWNPGGSLTLSLDPPGG